MNLLQQLKDIHPPDPVAFWPLAIGWYVLFGVVVLLLVWSGWILWCRYQRQANYRYALSILQQLRERASNGDDTVIAELSTLLRRTALMKYPRIEIAGLAGEAWLRFLDRVMDGHEFHQGVGRVLVDAPYQKNPKAEWPALFELVENWMEKLRR